MRHWFLLGNAGLAKLANVEFTLILVLVLVFAARALRWRDSWVLGLLFMGASPVLCWAAKTEYADFAMTAYFALGAMLIWRQFQHPRSDLALPAGLALGFAGACKYQGLVLAAAACAAFLLAAAVARMPRRQVLRTVGMLALGVLLVGAAWWLRSWINTGTPFYPFFAPAGSSEDVRGLFEVNKFYGPGRTLAAFLLIGYHIGSMTPYGFGDPFGFGFPLLLLQIAAGLALLGFVRSRRGFSPGLVFLTAVSGTYLIFWFWTGPVLRYLASILPLMAVLFLASLKELGVGRRLPVVLTLFCTVLAVQASLLTSTIRRFGFLPPVTLAQKDAVLAGSLPYYPAVRALNAARKPADRTYLLFASNAMYYVDGDSYGDWFGKYSFMWLAKNAESIESVVDKLRRERFRYVLVSHADAANVNPAFAAGSRILTLAASSRELPGARRIFSDGRYSVFQLPLLGKPAAEPVRL